MKKQFVAPILQQGATLTQVTLQALPSNFQGDGGV